MLRALRLTRLAEPGPLALRWRFGAVQLVFGSAAVVVGLSARTLREFDRFDVGRTGVTPHG